MMLRVVALLLILMATSAPAEILYPAAGDPVPGAPGKNYLDLLEFLVGDLTTKDGNLLGRPVQELRHLAGPDQGDAAPDVALDFSLSSILIKVGGQDRLALLVDFGHVAYGAQGYAILGLFSLGVQPKLLDAANVAVDRGTSFAHSGMLEVGVGESLILTESTHFNSSQGYRASLPILVRGDQLELIDIVSTLDVRLCAFERKQVLSYNLLAEGAPYRSIEATVTDITQPTSDDCGDEPPPEAATKTFRVNYRWDAVAARYLPDSDAFEKLAEENYDRY